MINLFKLIKAYWRGFVGGPDFNRCISHSFILENKQLTIKVPSSNVVAAPSTVDVSFPRTSKRWFTQNAETERQHCYVHMMAENWMYMPPIVIFPSSEYGMLSFELRIKQINTINVLDQTALSHYVTQAYDDFHNGPDEINTRIRQRNEEEFNRSSCSWSQEEKKAEMEAEIAIDIELNGRQTLAPAIIKVFNKLTWVFYREIKNNHKSHMDYYCLALSEHSLLEVEFRHRVDLSNKHKKWAEHALALQERIMASIYLDDIALTQDSLIEHESVP